MKKLAELVSNGEDRIIQILHVYTLGRGYAQYSSTLEEAWRMSIRVLSSLIVTACTAWNEPPELTPDEDYEQDPITEFGIIEAQRHRERGINIVMFLSLLKYYRQSYLDLVMEAGFEQDYYEKARRFVDRFYDRIELGICSEWTKTEATQLLDELRTSNRIMTNEKNKYLTVYESLPHPAIILNKDLRIEHMNNAAMEMLRGTNIPGSQYYCYLRDRQVEGLEDDDDNGSGDVGAECFEGEAMGKMFPWLSSLLIDFSKGDEKQKTFERRVERDNGALHFEVKMSKMLDISEKFSGYVVVLTDITHRKLAEESLRESEERYRLIFDHSPVGIMHFDSDGIIRDFNDRFEEIMGAPRAKLLGFNMLERLRDPAMLQAIQDSLKGKLGQYEGDYRSVTGGKTTPMRALYKRILTQDGSFLGAVALFEDITERKRMEQELLRSKKLETIGTLAGGLAHDFNNILSVVLGNVEMALSDIESDTPTSECLEAAEKAALQAKDLTNKFITFSMGGAPQKKVVSVQELITNSINLALTGSNVQCEYAFANASDASDLVEVDHDQMTQVLYNVVVNAREAMPEGGIIRISADCVETGVVNHEIGNAMKKGQYTRISIKDKGMGIPIESLEKVFDPYFSTKEMGVQKGMGLGLAIVQSVVNKHDGYVRIESEVGSGTTVHIYLPVSKKKRDVLAVEHGKREFISGDHRVLLMDDEDTLAAMAKEMLGRLGYEAQVTKDGDEALREFMKAKESEKQFDVVILDLTIKGGMGGKELVKRLLEIDPAVNAVVSSGYSNDPVLSAFQEYGFRGALPKPFQMKELRDVLHKVLS